jgi:hypothetical protein
MGGEHCLFSSRKGNLVAPTCVSLSIFRPY